MENGTKAFREWLTDNQQKLADYTTEDIVRLATACGFDKKAVMQWAVSHKFFHQGW